MLKRYFQWLGILPFDLRPYRVPFATISNCICARILTFYAQSTSWFFIFDAVTFQDYSKSFFLFLSASLGLSLSATYCMGKDEVAAIFDDFNEIIEKSQWSCTVFFRAKFDSIQSSVRIKQEHDGIWRQNYSITISTTKSIFSYFMMVPELPLWNYSFEELLEWWHFDLDWTSCA